MHEVSLTTNMIIFENKIINIILNILFLSKKGLILHKLCHKTTVQLLRDHMYT